MVMLPSAATPLLRSLNNLGAPRKQRESIAEQVAREGMSWWGAERRVLALEERLGAAAALDLMNTQPECLRLTVDSVCDFNEHLVTIDKQFGVGVDESVERRAEREPEVVGSSGAARICLAPDREASGALVLAKNDATFDAFTSLLAARDASVLHAALVLGTPKWSATVVVGESSARATSAARGELMLGPLRGEAATLVWLDSTGDDGTAALLDAVAEAGHPVVGTKHGAYREFLHCAALRLPLTLARTKMVGGCRVPDRPTSSWSTSVPLTPRGWRGAFKSNEPVKDPAGGAWPDAALQMGAALHWRAVA